MEHESFESEATASLMNEHFVSIKVDREERPDVDRVRGRRHAARLPDRPRATSLSRQRFRRGAALLSTACTCCEHPACRTRNLQMYTALTRAPTPCRCT